VRTSCSSEDEESLCGGGEGIHSSGTIGGSLVSAPTDHPYPFDTQRRQ